METEKMRTVYSIVERSGKSYWTRVGIGFVNRDGSLNLKLECLPLNGTLQVREYEPWSERRAEDEAPRSGRTAPITPREVPTAPREAMLG